MAGAIAVAPMVVGADPLPDTTTFLNRVEGGGFDHNRAHIRASPAAVRRANVRLDLCEDDDWRADNGELCPAEPPTLAATTSARLAGAEVGPLGPTQPDGLWGPLLGIPSTAIHAVVLPTNKVLFVSQPKWPTEDESVVGGNAHVWDPVTNTSHSVPPPDVPYPSGPDRPANLWCGGQTTLADGRVLVVGGNLEYPLNGGIGEGNGFKGGTWVMTFDPWTETWTRYADMPHGRWYPTLTELPDGRVLIVGGWDETGGEEGAGGPGDAPRMVNNQDVEVFDPSTPPGGQATTVVSQLPPNGPGQPTPYPDHRDIGLYPHMFLLPDTTALGHGGDKVLVAGPGKLAVGGSSVDPLGKSFGGWFAVERLVRAGRVVPIEVARKGPGAGGAGRIRRGIGPLAKERLDQALDFAVGARAVGPGEDVADPKVPTGGRVQVER